MRFVQQKHYFDTLQTVGNNIETFEIFAALARNAKDLYVINEGPDKMFVKTYSGDKGQNMDIWQAVKRKEIDPQYYHPMPLYPTAECWVYPGQTKCFHDVYKLLISKTSIGNQYRITEFIPAKSQSRKRVVIYVLLIWLLGRVSVLPWQSVRGMNSLIEDGREL